MVGTCWGQLGHLAVWWAHGMVLVEIEQIHAHWGVLGGPCMGGGHQRSGGSYGALAWLPLAWCQLAWIAISLSHYSPPSPRCRCPRHLDPRAH